MYNIKLSIKELELILTLLQNKLSWIEANDLIVSITRQYENQISNIEGD